MTTCFEFRTSQTCHISYTVKILTNVQKYMQDANLNYGTIRILAQFISNDFLE